MRSGLILAVVLGGTSGAVADTINVPGDFDTIQGAIDAAMSGDEINVAPGTYVETINLLGKAIELRSSDGAEVTIIDADGLGIVVTCDSFETATTIIEGFTITGANWSQGAGMFNQNSSPTVRDCIFLENETDGWGGGILNSASSPSVVGCTFTGNTASLGGGIRNYGNSFPTITDCMFAANIARAGGAISSQENDAVPSIGNTLFCENVPDAIQGLYEDLGGNEFARDCDLFLDCNDNGVYDWIDIAKGDSLDVNNNSIPDECECLADLNGDGTVGAGDLLVLLGMWGTDPNGPPDLDGSGEVGASDLLMLLIAWGPCP